MTPIKKYLFSLITKSYQDNNDNIISLLGREKNAALIDLGCDDGKWTKKLAKRIGTDKLYGVEVVKQRILYAKKRGLVVTNCDLNDKLPLLRNNFDIVHSNQVIEHLNDTDTFISEIYRILKPGGYAVISTENLSSWHNIFALILGFQPFSMTNFSFFGNIGNPFALWNGKVTKNSSIKAWQHQRLFSYFGIADILKSMALLWKR